MAIIRSVQHGASRLCALAALALTVATTGRALHAQQGGDTDVVVIRRSDLTPAQRVSVDKAQFESRVDQYGKWVGLGREIGDAVNGSLSAVTTQAAAFAKTDVGRITVAPVVWKVIASDVLHFGFAILLLAVGLPIWVWSYKRTSVDHAVLKSVAPDGTKTYSTADGSGDAGVAHAIIMVALLMAVITIAFTG